MPICKECKEVVGAMEINPNGVCKTCEPNKEEEENSPVATKEEVKVSEDIYGIITFVLGIIGFFGIAIITAPIALVLGHKYSKGTILAKIGIVLAWIQVAIMIFSVLGGIIVGMSTTKTTYHNYQGSKVEKFKELENKEPSELLKIHTPDGKVDKQFNEILRQKLKEIANKKDSNN